MEGVYFISISTFRSDEFVRHSSGFDIVYICTLFTDVSSKERQSYFFENNIDLIDASQNTTCKQWTRFEWTIYTKVYVENVYAWRAKRERRRGRRSVTWRKQQSLNF